ncbi:MULTISPECIES: AraC family transcriptional regulator [Cyanophyceae]|uniref:AraC family transcriptional regulator n=1 Tax=Cyanophyceae TaxID=3028117 RepID=UPI00168569EF|nr:MULTISPECIES: AraC family transcriptional regulator [Cyanophyceae]MBD1918353.1 helix-turn-helix transcriptional regulator [Phormidium sp. FACHB-77]MBD2028778.1 helix-turn-helix transcriptional regulator [Phormidium sp. FACHB-322]MBD2051199.1 helix-turn-helix transcriptional regulator [Leptolyngbya sp. FACHB-60]
MKNKAAEISVLAWESDGILLERYAYKSGSVEPLPRHSHEEYQFGLSFNCQGEYHYRGAYHSIPTGSLSVIHSGEVHAPSDRNYLPAPAHFEMMHINPKWLHTIAAEMAEKPANLPFFPTAFLTDSKLNHLFLALQAVVNQKTSELEQDIALLDFLSYLIRRYASNSPSVCSLKPPHAAVMLACDYLHAHYASEISLDTLAAIAGLSRFHFCRIFRKEIGVSSSAYQTQLRIAQAKKLLVQGFSITKVATATGFYDQSHFGWHFKRQIGVTPGAYVSKTAITS